MAKKDDGKDSKPTDVEAAGVRVVGYLGRLVGEARVKAWAPADEAAVDARLTPSGAPSAPISQDPQEPAALPPKAPDGPVAAEARKAAAELSTKTAEAREAVADLSAKTAEAREAAERPAGREAATGRSAGPGAGSDRKEERSSHVETPHDIVLTRVQRMVRERPEDSAKLLRTMLLEEGAGAPDAPEAVGASGASGAGGVPGAIELPMMQKISVLMVALGQETSGEVMKFLSDYEIEEITHSVAALKGVSVALQDQVLEEFEQHQLAGEWVSSGGMDFARGALERAVGPRKTQEILDRISSKVSSGFYMLKNVAPEQVAPFISHEHPQTIALILSQLESAQSAGILSQLPQRMQSDVSYRIATMENITPAILKDIEEALEASLRDILSGNQDVGGPKVVADMLNMTGSSTEKNVLDQMDAQDPEVAEAVRNLMFVFADIVKLSDLELQALLREIDQKDLVIALTATGDELRERLLGNMPEETRAFLEQEMESLTPMRLSEVEEVQLRIVQQARQMEEQGKLTIVRGEDETWVYGSKNREEG